MLSKKVLVGTIVRFLLMLVIDSAAGGGYALGSTTPSTNSSLNASNFHKWNNLRLRNDWRAEAHEAMDGATNQVQHNLLVVLAELGKDTFKASRFFKFSISSLMTAMLNRTFDYAGILASSPKLLTESLPTQLVSILRGMQSEPKISPQLNSTISTVIDFILDAEASGVSQNLFRPATNVLPNLLSGVNTFLVSILQGFFYVIGARDPNELYGPPTTPRANNWPTFLTK